MQYRVNCRGIILHQDKLLAVHFTPELERCCLPGGGLEVGETVEDAMIREIQEELGITPHLWGIYAVHELIKPQEEIHYIEFIYHITNPQDFLDADFSTASHAHEMHEVLWLDIHQPQYTIHPDSLIHKIKTTGLTAWPLHLLTSI